MIPTVVVHGVYRVRYEEQAFRERLLDYYSRNVDTAANDVIAFVDRTVPLVLMDLSISGIDERFDVGEFTQAMPGAPSEAWQVPYDEALLSADGTVVLMRHQGCAKGIREGRIAFYFHYYDPVSPMRWTYGIFSCPSPEPISVKLLTLVPYERI